MRSTGRCVAPSRSSGEAVELRRTRRCQRRSGSTCLGRRRGRRCSRRSRRLGDVAEAVDVRKRAQLVQALVLDLPDPLAGHVERAAELVERVRVPALEPVAELEYAPLALTERRETPAQLLVAQRRLRRLLRQAHRLVTEKG